MLVDKCVKWGKSRSCIRELMEYGNKRKQEIGSDKVFDFSIGNPSVPAPKEVNESIKELLNDPNIHSYTTAAGLFSLREKVANDLTARLSCKINPNHMYITCGAAAGLTISLKAILNQDEEVIVIAPFFPEYRIYIESMGGIMKVASPRVDLTIDPLIVKELINEKTKAIIVDSPNNPCGVVYPKENLIELANVLREKEQEYQHPIYLISDEPYRELVYGHDSVPCPLSYYDDSIMCYSFSKSMSLPGERIGYIALNENISDVEEVYASILGAGRALGFVNAPSLFQKVIEKAYGHYTDVKVYERNKDLLCSMLDELGYSYIKPNGAFYLFMKALEDDAIAFSEVAKKYELLLVPSDDFGIPGYVRVAYCVDESVIKNSYDSFKKLKEEYEVR